MIEIFLQSGNHNNLWNNQSQNIKISSKLICY